MTSRLLPAGTLLAQMARFDAIIDTRTPAEFGLDHIPGATNCPVLSDAERIEVGTLYKEAGPFIAKKRGAALVARNIAHHLDTTFAALPRDWTPLVYCWRGGQRSGAMTHVLGEIGWTAFQLEHGYKGFRRRVIDDLEKLPAVFTFHVLCGPTGTGKSALLRTLAGRAQVLDLEALAAHRGSLLGAIDDVPQPSQKGFETALWQTLRGFDSSRPVLVESEGARIGRLSLPPALMDALRHSPCIVIDTPRHERVTHLILEYPGWVNAPEALGARLTALIGLHSRAAVAAWQALIHGARWPELVEALLVEHYDPAYRRSLGSDFTELGAARHVSMESLDAIALERAADEILALSSSSGAADAPRASRAPVAALSI